MRLVLDSNEYILGFGEQADQHPVRLLEYLVDHPDGHDLVVSRTIIEEVRRNLTDHRFSRVWSFLALFNVVIVENWEFPAALPEKSGC